MNPSFLIHNKHFLTIIIKPFSYTHNTPSFLINHHHRHHRIHHQQKFRCNRPLLSSHLSLLRHRRRLRFRRRHRRTNLRSCYSLFDFRIRSSVSVAAISSRVRFRGEFVKMFWRMAGLSTASPVETILEKENFTLEELLDEDEIIQECKALNSRLICFLRQRPQVEQLVRYIVEEGVEEDAEMKRTFKYPLVSCEIFTCEVDIMLKTLVEDEKLMNLLFSFLEPNRPHSTLLSGYFSKVMP
ncbi:Serine/threonine-protein phosphatase 6 regulatory subunit 2-like protein, partial [Drosera capensis]